MSRNIDYSKWDRMEWSDSDDDDSRNNEKNNERKVQVTRFDQPCSVTLHGGHSRQPPTIRSTTEKVVQPQQQQPKKNNGDGIVTTTTTNRHDTMKKKKFLKNNETTTVAEKKNTVEDDYCPDDDDHVHSGTGTVPVSWTEKGAAVAVNDLQVGSEEEEEEERRPDWLYWCQDRYSVTLRFPLKEYPASNRTKANYRCHVSGMLSYSDRNMAVFGSATKQPQRLSVTRTPGCEAGNNNKIKQQNDAVVILQGDLPYPVHSAEDDDDDDVEWTIERWHDRPYLVVTLYKAVPMQDVTVWWKRPLEQCPEIDVTTFRSQQQGTQTFAEAWKVAHSSFQEQIAARRKHAP